MCIGQIRARRWGLLYRPSYFPLFSQIVDRECGCVGRAFAVARRGWHIHRIINLFFYCHHAPLTLSFKSFFPAPRLIFCPRPFRFHNFPGFHSTFHSSPFVLVLYVTNPFSFTVISLALFQAYPAALDEWGLAEAMRADGKLESVMDKHHEEFIVRGSLFPFVFSSPFGFAIRRCFPGFSFFISFFIASRVPRLLALGALISPPGHFSRPRALCILSVTLSRA
jgi:hypothetical protein